MSEHPPLAPGPVLPATGSDAVIPAGSLLRAARERSGIALEDAAQQLKLAPRQVKALEEGDFGSLPGRTFVRGFVRNYARLLKLDTAEVLAALPEASVDAGLLSPVLHPTAPSIGELPLSQNGRSGWFRWAVALTLLTVAAAVVYEFLWPTVPGRTAPAVTAPPGEPIVEAKPVPAAAEAVATPAMPAATPLPNPLAATPASSPPGSADPASAAPAAAESPAMATAPVGPPAAGDRQIVLSYRDHSWTEVRDRNGRVLLSTMMAPGSRQALTGAPPFDLVIGNAADVTLTVDGRNVDLAPYTRKSVARFTLP